MKNLAVWVLRILGAFLSAGLAYYFTRSPFLAGWGFIVLPWDIFEKIKARREKIQRYHQYVRC
ncbi:hypothetical protein KAJ26_05340 [bacterium]|nr:hypothetical protein [bacterium]